MRLGTIDAGVITNAPIPRFEPRMMVLDLPFIFKTRESAFKVMDGAVGKQLFGYLDAQNLKGLAYFDAGWRMVVLDRGSRSPSPTTTWARASA